MNIAPVTQSAITSLMANELSASQNALQILQTQLATGMNISQPSDNPAGTEQLLGLGASQTRFAQYQANATNGMSIAQLGDGTLANAVNVLQSARATMVSAGGPGITAASATGLIQNLQGDYNTLLGLANTSYMGNAIFAGTSGSPAAYDASGNYLGTNTAPARTVSPGFSASVSVTAPFGATGSPTNMFTVLQNTINDLKAGNYSAASSTDLASFDQAFNQVTSAAATQGEYYQQLQYMQSQAGRALQDIQTQYGNLQNVNTAQVSTQYSQQLSDYQIALNVASKAVEPTLANFI